MSRSGRVIVAMEQALVIAAPNTPILLNLETALGLTIVARQPVYVVQLLRWAIERTAGAAAVTFSPGVFDDGAAALPIRKVDSMGTAIAVATQVRTPPAPVIFTAPLGVVAFLPGPNVGGDTFRIRAVLELLQ